MKKFIIMIGLISLFLSSIAQAQSWSWISPVRYIESITTTEGATVFVLSGNDVTPSQQCVNRFIIRTTNSNYSALLASLLTAHSLGSPISVRFDSSDTACESTADRIVMY